MTTKCAYCTTVLCEGCKQSMKRPFFTGYKRQFYFRETNKRVDKLHEYSQIWENLRDSTRINA